MSLDHSSAFSDSGSGAGTYASRCRRCGIVIGFGEHCDFCQQRHTGYVDAPGEYMGRHHTEWIATVDQLVLQGHIDAAEFLLVRLVDATEAESLLTGVPPFERHFSRLGQIVRSRGDDKLSRDLRRRYKECAQRAPAPEREAG